MAADGIKIEGLAELDKLLKELPAKIEGNIMRGAIRAGSKVMESKAKELVPTRTGALRDSIKTRVGLRRGKVTATIRSGNRQAFYAHMVEFGTAAHFIKPKNRKSLFFAGIARDVVSHPGAKKKPFMRPAFDASRQAAMEAVRDYIKARLPKEFAKQEKLAALAKDNE